MTDLLHAGSPQSGAQQRDLMVAIGTGIGDQLNLDQFMIKQGAINFGADRRCQAGSTRLHDGFEVVGLFFECAARGTVQMRSHEIDANMRADEYKS